MARKFEIGRNRYAWNPEQCEEHLLIAAFHDIQSRLPPSLPWVEDFLDHFYHRGSGVAFDTLVQLNIHLRRLGQPTITFVETDLSDHGRTEDRALKAQLRCRSRDAYLALDTTDRVRWVNIALDRVASLPPPHQTFEEWNARRTSGTAAALTSTERAARARAVSVAPPAQPATTLPAPPPLPPSNGHTLSAALLRAITQLGLTRSPVITEKVISSLSPDDALNLASSGKIEDPAVIDGLVLRSLEASP
jgi:hypothetical protein